MDHVDNREEVREFLSTRRAKITPQQAGLTAYGRNRRVSGLRREEVAMLAGVSVDYYTRLEKGNLSGVSESVLDGITTALQLDEAEAEHLANLARAANTTPRKAVRHRSRQEVRPSLQRVLTSMTTSPAFIRNARLDVLAVNALGEALYAPAFADTVRPANLARFCFLDRAAEDFYPSWSDAANTSVNLLRAEAGRHPFDRSLTELVGELSTRSAEFRTRWAAHDVRLHRSGVKQFDHPVVGRLDLSFDAMELPGSEGLTLTAYTAEPGSASEEKLSLLASWAVTVDPPSVRPRPR